MSKLGRSDTHEYMLKCGIKDMFLQEGLMMFVKTIGDHVVDAVAEDGLEITIHVDLAIPSPRRDEQWQRWKKQLTRCQKLSAAFRVFGSHEIAKGQIRIDENSAVISQAAKLSSRELRVFEWCAGGFGGWRRAASFLRQHGHDVTTTAAGDNDQPMTCMWNRNSAELDQENPTCHVLDLTKHEDWNISVETGSNSASLSTPCKSFSSGGLVQGFDSREGQYLPIALQMARVHGYQLLLVENVANLWLDGSLKSKLIDILQFVGYEIAYGRILSLSTAHPAERSRLLLVLTAKDADFGDALPILDFMSGVHIPRQLNLWSTDRWLDPPESLLHQLVLDDEVLNQYASKKRLPATMRNNLQCDSRDEILWQRTVRSNQMMPSGTMMASYNRQHDFQENKVIYGSLRRHNYDSFQWRPPHQYRFFHAAEVAVAMGLSTKIHLPRNDCWSMTAVGNCIAEFHAIAALSAALRIIGWNDIDRHA